MIPGVIAKRRGGRPEPFRFHGASAMVVSTAARSYSDARVSLVAMTAARQSPQKSRADVSLVSMSVARTAPQKSRADVPLLVLAVARPAPITITLIRAERMAVMIVHS